MTLEGAKPASDTPGQDSLIYPCPHCGDKVEVEGELAGERIKCPHCHEPFELGVPVAQPLTEAQEREVQPGTTHRIDDVDELFTQEKQLHQYHPAVYRSNLGRTLLAVLILGGLLFSAFAPLTVGNFSGAGVFLALALLPLGYLLYLYLLEYFTSLTITSKRTVYRRGILARKTAEVSHDDVQTLYVNQGRLDRLLGVGDIKVSSAGEKGIEIVARDFPNPEDIIAVVRRLQDK